MKREPDLKTLEDKSQNGAAGASIGRFADAECIEAELTFLATDGTIEDEFGGESCYI